MNGSRRRLLAASGSLVASLAGCLSSVPGGGPSSGARPESEATARTTTDSNGTRSTTDYPDAVAVTTTVERDDLEYVEANDSVRYVAAWRTNHSGETPTRKPVYETVPFEEWAETECASAAATRVGEVVSERLGGADEGIATGVTYERGEATALVVHQTTLDRDGDVVSEPTVSYRRVKRVAPERARVALSFAGRTRECEVPVETRQTTIRQQ